jgi:hypothetical protein
MTGAGTAGVGITGTEVITTTGAAGVVEVELGTTGHTVVYRNLVCVVT